MLVVDSSSIASLYFPEKYSKFVENYITSSEGDKILTLDLAFYELANVIRKRIIRGEIKRDDGKRIFKSMLNLMSTFEIHHYNDIIGDTLDLALENNITIYDASFLQLAIKYNAKLLTTDLKLITSTISKFTNHLVKLNT
ncbi:type II toxin-antitoxin system VapC family toxin [Sulfolobus tengchongensis]|uniref:Type II toxin-antitoxin system VapC family toxin n=1 Tax=Sulfolobus tengchongensis TaxID=207809 RepID=A0AAX4L1N7_9CREN